MDTSSHTVARLAAFHIRRYKARLARVKAGSKEYTLAELQDAIGCWGCILSKGCKWTNLTDAEQLVVNEALLDELPEDP